jgi:glyoxylase-like metal-dependent hydrolase (beta-lactamase superfamily II)
LPQFDGRRRLVAVTIDRIGGALGMLIETFPVGLLGCNCTILGDESTSDAVVIDPGGDVDQIQARLRRHQLQVRAIIHTHTHIDHVGACGDLQRATGAPARIHEADRFMLNILGLQAAFIGLPQPPAPDVDGDLRDDTVIRVGSIELVVMHTPGHSPGSVCFLVHGADRTIVWSGDTLFQQGIGRTDLWGGDTTAIERSIRRRLYCLEDHTLVIPGHGGETTIGEEKRTNPFVRA